MTQTIAIFTYRVEEIPPWDPDTIKTGVAGSEEAVIYLSQKLAELGYQVFVFGNPPAHSVHSLPEANPRFVDLAFPIHASFDFAISWRMPNSAQMLKRIARKVYLWPHDVLTFTCPVQESDFDEVLWLSHWQREQWISVQPSFAKFNKIFGNGVNPEQFKPISPRNNPYSCIYASNYGRGLEVLISLWSGIKQVFPKVTLDIYYGWQHWGLISKEKESQLKRSLSQLPDVCEHGQVGHEELTRAYETASFWTYPCTLPETFCISALRAQLAGAVPVVIRNCALKETVRHGFCCSNVEEYDATLKSALGVAEKIESKQRSQMGEFVLQEFTWEQIAQKLKNLFNHSCV